MSLFERIQNKRYDLQEKKKYNPSDALRKAIGKQSELDAAKDFKKDVGKDITPEVKGDVKTKIDTSNRFFTDQPDSKTLRTKTTGDEGQFKSSKVKFDSGAKGKFVSGSPDLGGTQKKFVKDRRRKLDVEINKTRSDNPNQTNISNQNKTKENKFKTRTDKALSNRDEFIKARKTYTDSKTGIGPGKPTEKGIIDYIAKARDKNQGTNANTKANRRAAKIIAQSSGSEYSDKIKNKYETDKSMARKRGKNQPSFSQVKADIDKRNPVIKGKTGGNIPDTPKNRRSMIPSDGGKEGQARIEKELELNKKGDPLKKGKDDLIKKNIRDTERVQRDLKNPTSDSFGPPEGKDAFPETDASREAKNRLNKNQRQTKNQTFVNKTKQNRELQRQSRLNQRTTTTNVRKNPGLSDFEKGQREFDKMFDKSKNKRQININPNKTQQNREIQKLFRQTNKNRTVSDVRKNPGLSDFDKGQLDFDKNLEKLKSKKNTVYVDKTPSFGKEGSGMSFKDLQKQMNKNTKKSFIKTPDPIKIEPIKTDPLRKPFDPLKTRKATKTLKALKKPTMLGKLAKASPYLAVAGILGTNLYNRIKKSQKTQNTTKTPKPVVPVVPSKDKPVYKVDTTRLSFSGLDGGRIANDQFGKFKKS